MTNCPNCAAPITDMICPYCGTRVIDCSEIDISNPQYFKFKFGDVPLVGRFYIKETTINLYEDGGQCMQDITGKTWRAPYVTKYNIELKLVEI